MDTIRRYQLMIALSGLVVVWAPYDRSWVFVFLLIWVIASKLASDTLRCSNCGGKLIQTRSGGYRLLWAIRVCDHCGYRN